MEIKEGYKVSEIGVIPTEWEAKTLKSAVSLINGRAFKQEELLTKGKYLILRVGNFFSNSGWYYSNMELPEYQYVIYGDLMYAWSASFGPKFWLGDKTIYHYHIWKVKVNREIDKSFMYYLFESDKQKILEQSQGGTMFHITKTDMEQRKIPLPPLPEQQAIAEVLTDTDNLIQALEKQIAKKKLIKQGVMQQLLTPKEGWMKKKLGESATIFRGGSPRPIESYLTTNPDGINWIKIGDVGKFAKFIESTEEKIIPEGMSRSRFVKEGDFLLSNSMSFGRPYIMKTSGCIHDGWLVIQNYQNHFDKEFLYYVLGSESVMQQYKAMASGSSVLNLNKEIVKNVIINCPESVKEQGRISTILSEIDNAINLLENKLLKNKTIKQGLMQQLLTGKIRLIES